MSTLTPLLRHLIRLAATCAAMAALCASPALAATSVDPTFTFAGSNTKCIAVQPDGRAVVAYDNFNGGGGRKLARLNEDGTKDPSFNPTFTGVIHCIAIQPDGKILIGGNFNRISGVYRANFARLLPDGSVDPTFNPSVDYRVSTIVVQADGRILFGGNFYKVSGKSRNNVARVSADGVLDDTFAPVLSDECSAIHVQADGRILLGGTFFDENWMEQRGVARFSDDGVRDTTFAPTLPPSRVVTWMAEQPDGKLLMIYSLMSMDPIMSGIQRVDATTGATDATYRSSITSGAIFAAYMQTDGRVVIAGAFSRDYSNYVLVRLGTFGQIDATLGAGPGGYFLPVHTLAPTANGRLLVGGDFTRILSTNRAGIARLYTDAVSTSVVAPDPTRVEWQRSATTPMLNRVTFESRTGNSPWSFLGHGQWSDGKWKLENTTLPENGVVRARGYLSATWNTSVYHDFLSIGETQPQLTIEHDGAILPPDGALNVGNLLSELKWEYHFKLTNTGDRKLEQISLSQFTGMNNPGTLPVTLQPGESTIITVSLLTSQLGAVDSSFTITSNAANHPSYTVRLSGTSTNVISPVFNSSTDVPAPGGGSLLASHTFGHLTLGFAPEPGTVLTVIQGITGINRLSNLPDGSIVTADYNGVTYQFLAGQQNSSNSPYSLTLTLLGGDGVLSKKHDVIYTDSLLSVADDGAFYLGLNRWDAAEQQDPVFKTSASSGTPKYLALVNGDFYYASDTNPASPLLVRLRNDGSTDPNFSAPIDARVQAMAALPDNRIIIGGAFATVSGVARPALARLHPDGSVDTGFVPQIDLTGNSVKTLAVQADGKILIGTENPMTLPGGTTSNLVRFMPDGAVDATFTLTTQWVNQLLVQPDGKILRLASNGVTSSRSVQRFHPDGSEDSSFSALTDGSVTNVALLADGKLLICGYFIRVGEHVCNGIARLHPDGSPDLTFFARTAARPNQAMVSGKNELFINGYVYGVSGVPVTALAELNNPTAITTVQQVNANTVRWMRQGGAAELQWVKAELIPQSGTPISLGLAQRIPGGWEISSPAPIANATVRLYGPAIHSDGMMVMVKDMLETGTVSPVVSVTHDEQVLSTSGTNDLGTSMVGFELTATLRLRNDGAGTLRAPTVTIEGTHAADFSIVQNSPTDLASGERRSFILKSRPSGGGLRTAQLVVRGSDPSVPAHVIPVSVTGINTLNPVFNSSADVPLTADGFDASVMNLGTITLGFKPGGTPLKLVDNTGTSPVSGRFMDLGERPHVSAVFDGKTYWFQLDYTLGNDIYLRPMGDGDLVPGFFVTGDGTGMGMAIQPDGKVLVSGEFNTIGGKSRSKIARLHPDGTVDESFSAQIKAPSESILVLKDGRIIIGGYYYGEGSSHRDALACLHPDGSLDESFNPVLYTGENQYAMANRFLQLKSGKILIGGRFTSVNGIPRTNLALLHPDGSLDESFTAAIEGQSPNLGHIYSLAEQADGKLLIGGSYGSVNGTARYCLSRLNVDGTLDTLFRPIINPNTTATLGDPYGTRVSAIVQLPDGRILIGGQFQSVNGIGRSRVALLDEYGRTESMDFWQTIADQPVTSFAVQEDGNILIGGVYGFKLVEPNGELITSFPLKITNVSNGINSVALDHEGNIWMTGRLGIPGNWPMQPIVKVKNSGGWMRLRLLNSHTIDWEVIGSVPALREVEFELSTDGGAVWTSLGAANRTHPGWSLENLALPPHGFIRAKGDGITSNRGAAHIENTLLFGRQPTKLEEWRMEQFGSYTNQRTGADLADADNDGVKNLVEYAFNLDPQDSSSAQVPAWTNDSSQFEIGFTPPANVEGVSYGVEWSSSMNPSDWQDVTNQGTGGGHRYVVPKDAPFKFMRLKVTNTGSLPPP